MDVFATFNDLLQQVATISLVEPSSADSMAVDGAHSGTSALLQAEVPRVVKVQQHADRTLARTLTLTATLNP